MNQIEKKINLIADWQDRKKINAETFIKEISVQKKWKNNKVNSSSSNKNEYFFYKIIHL